MGPTVGHREPRKGQLTNSACLELAGSSFCRVHGVVIFWYRNNSVKAPLESEMTVMFILSMDKQLSPRPGDMFWLHVCPESPVPYPCTLRVRVALIHIVHVRVPSAGIVLMIIIHRHMNTTIDINTNYF